jgi:hypothetical protein
LGGTLLDIVNRSMEASVDGWRRWPDVATAAVKMMRNDDV